MLEIKRLLSLAAVASAMVAVFPTSAQEAARPRLAPVRGTIESVDGQVITIKSREGREVKLVTPENVVVSGVVKISLSDIKPGSFIGVAGLPKPDGSQDALSVVLFPGTLPQAVRDQLEGFTPYNLLPDSTMTNASLDRIVTVNDGNQLTVKFGNSQKTIFVKPDTPIVTLVPGEKSELKAGAKILAATLKKSEDIYDAPRVLVGRNGLAPPM